MTTATAVSICSNALLLLGSAPISSLEQGTDQARLCANLYPPTRDALLRLHPWNCAVKRAVLAPLADDPVYGAGRQFALPGDWLRTIQLTDASGRVPDFRHEGRRLLTDAGALRLRYVWRNENESSYDDLLVQALTLKMASVLAYPVTKSTSLRESLMQEFQRLAMPQAKSIDAMEEPGDAVAEESPLLSIRR